MTSSALSDVGELDVYCLSRLGWLLFPLGIVEISISRLKHTHTCTNSYIILVKAVYSPFSIFALFPAVLLSNTNFNIPSSSLDNFENSPFIYQIFSAFRNLVC